MKNQRSPYKLFKPSPLGPIPEDWEVVRLGEVFRFVRGFSYRKIDISKDSGILFLTINDLEKEGGKKRNTANIYLKPNVNIPQKYLIEEFSLFVANTDMSKGFIIGAPLLYCPEGERAVYSMDLTRLVPTREDLSLEFYFYLLTYVKVRRIVKTFGQGTNVIHLNHQLFKHLLIPLPPLPEQKRIAEVLRTVDEAILKVEQEIEHTERLKRGLMQHLLSRGIGYTHFKDSPIGKIPEEWDVVRLGQVTKVVQGFAFPIKYQTKNQGKYPFVKVGDMNSSEKYIKEAEFFIDEEDLKRMKVKIYPSGTIIFPKIGMAIYLNKFRILSVSGTIDNNVAGLIPSDKVDPEFLFYWLSGKLDLVRLSGRTTAPSIKKSTIQRVSIPLPPFPEQKRIAEILMTVDRKLELLRQKKVHLERIKKGLMNDLLTGKKRLKVNLEGDI